MQKLIDDVEIGSGNKLPLWNFGLNLKRENLKSF